MAQGDVYYLVHNQTWYGQQVINKYWYRQTTSAGDAQGLTQAWIEDIYPLVKAIQTVDVVHLTVAAYAYDNLTDFFNASLLSETGALTGDPGRPYEAYAFRLTRTTRETRHGQKRYAGVSDDLVTQGVPIAAQITRLAALQAVLDDTITAGASLGSYEPVIVRIDRNTASPTYGQILAVNLVSGSNFVRVSTQNSRKIGRGA
jgi:hypothetical protein